MFLIYDVIFLIYACFYLPYLFLTGRWHKDWRGRLGFLPDGVKQAIRSRHNIWLHAVSVGEVIAIENLIRQMKVRFPADQIVVSVTTKAGYELAQKRLSTNAVVIIAPLDFSWVVKEFVRLIRPRLYVAAETELWPNLFAVLDKNRVPIMVVNGRISDRSFPRYKKIAWALKKTIFKVSCLCMQSPLDAERIKVLGALPERVQVTGNIKFDDLPNDTKESFNDFGFKQNALLWICGSTHPGEEEIILNVYQRILIDRPQWRLVIAPRHVERSCEVISLIQHRGLKAVPFTEVQQHPCAEDAVLVVDTIGHLRSFYALASMVFVGKSLCVGGGHNVIEPAFFAKPIIIGPKMENFRDIVQCFKKENALVQVDDAHAFEAAVRELAGNETKRQELGRRARMVIDANQGAGAKTIEVMARYLK